jgi:hypothetical protein
MKLQIFRIKSYVLINPNVTHYAMHHCLEICIYEEEKYVWIFSTLPKEAIDDIEGISPSSIQGLQGYVRPCYDQWCSPTAQVFDTLRGHA